jgi:hypothetical protein
VFSCYEILYKKKNTKDWIGELTSKNRSNPINRLFDWPFELFPNGKQNKPGDMINIIQFFTLLENVYRNVLLRPYIPAYRTINTDCGRYRSFIEPLGSNIFEQLGFEYHPPNLYTYTVIDQSETIKCAVACSILIVCFSDKLNRALKPSSNNQRRNEGQ